TRPVNEALGRRQSFLPFQTFNPAETVSFFFLSPAAAYPILGRGEAPPEKLRRRERHCRDECPCRAVAADGPAALCAVLPTEAACRWAPGAARHRCHGLSRPLGRNS